MRVKPDRFPIIHTCQLPFRSNDYDYGLALDNEFYYDKKENNIIATNNEYALIVIYCPMCGINLRDLIDK